MENKDIKLTPFQKNNLLQFLNRVPVTGFDEANALLEIVNIIRSEEKPKEPITDNQSTN